MDRHFASFARAVAFGFGADADAGHGHHRGPFYGRGPRGRRGGPEKFGPGGFGPGGFGDWGRGWGPPFDFRGRGPRARRGDIRAGILHLLADVDRPMHGYEMIRELQERSGGAWRPSAGSIYPTLQLLEDEGLVASTEDSGKRLYSLTDAGREEIANRGGQAPWEEFAEAADSPWHELRNAGMGLMAAAMQGAHAANEDQLGRITDTLREARSRIYRILGDDEPGDTNKGDTSRGDTTRDAPDEKS